MSDLAQALENYVKTKKPRSTIQGFISNDEKHIEVLIVWFETFAEYDDALKFFISKFKRVYKDIVKKSYKSQAKVDMKRIFQQSKSQTNAMVNGSKVLDEATNAASERLILRLRRSPKIVPGASSFPSTTGASSPTAAASSPTAAASSPTAAASSPTAAASSPTAAASSSTAAASSIEEKLNSYIKSCKDKSRKHGFNLQTQVHEVLASQDIILLKEGQVCPELAKHVDAEYLLNNIRAKAMPEDVTVDSMMYLSLCTLFGDVNNTADRTKLKIEINRLFEVASKEDRNIIEIFANGYCYLNNRKLLPEQFYFPDNRKLLPEHFYSPKQYFLPVHSTDLCQCNLYHRRCYNIFAGSSTREGKGVRGCIEDAPLVEVASLITGLRSS